MILKFRSWRGKKRNGMNKIFSKCVWCAIGMRKVTFEADARTLCSLTERQKKNKYQMW